MRPSMDDTLMRVAMVVSERSTCSRLSVGAVLSLDGRVLSTGYNGAPAGMPHCEHRGAEPDTWLGCQAAVHAEANAIAFAAKNGVRIEGATLFTTHSPCMTCAFLIINAGVITVVYQDLYRTASPIDVLDRAGVRTRHYWGTE